MVYYKAFQDFFKTKQIIGNAINLHNTIIKSLTIYMSKNNQWEHKEAYELKDLLRFI